MLAEDMVGFFFFGSWPPLFSTSHFGGVAYASALATETPVFDLYVLE